MTDRGIFGNLKGDIFGGVTAAVVALPLALAFGVASGVGPIAGLYGAIAVGFFAAVFGGTPSQVSGPTGPMTVAMAAVVIQYADTPGTAFLIVILSGVLQIIFGMLKVGRYVSYTPHSVVSGFMSGIGVIIILIQTLPFVGLATAGGGPIGAISAWPDIPKLLNSDALAIATASLAVMMFWPARLNAILPSALAALLVGTGLALTIFSGAPIIGDVPTGLPAIQFPDITLGGLPGLFGPAVILALLGSIDSLLTSLVADSITRTRHNSNRELVGQGIGNIAAGLVGGLPGAGATMRTVVNVRAGGRTPLSGALHAVILLALVLGLGPLAEQVPHAALAGILMKVGWDIIDWKYLKRIAIAPKDNVFVMLVTFGMTVFIDLITAVGVGIILASFVAARRAETHELEGVTALAMQSGGEMLSPQEDQMLEELGGEVALVNLRGRFSYASARQLTHSIG
ncbi:MAG TPA: SulP family inorganic anion transporter, partial [Rhizobiales bacterium]|nr:SulP family inorganic anion transporter [Hyphomicrobiales bacterium]